MSSVIITLPDNVQDAVQIEIEEVPALQRRIQIAVCVDCGATGRHQHRMHPIVREHRAGMLGRGVPEAGPESTQVLWPAVYGAT